MDASRIRCTLLTLLTLTTGAEAETVFLCRSAEGPPLFSDLPCRHAHPTETTRLGVELQNVAQGMALGEADRRHLAAIEERAPRRARITGLPDPERVARCAALREEMDALRRAARQGHDGSLGGERRRLRRAIRDACH